MTEMTRRKILGFLSGLYFGVCCNGYTGYTGTPQMRTLIKPQMRKVINKTGAFVFGLFVGFFFAMLLVSNETHRLYWIRDTEIDLKVSPDSILDISNRLNVQNRTLEDVPVANKLYNEVKVLCWIMTDPDNHRKKAMHVKNTWGARCNKLLFMSSEEDEILGTIALNVTEGRDGLWGKTKQSFEYIYENYLNDYDWFLKADDDTYVIVENLRYFLYSYSTESPIYFGCKFKQHVQQGYMSGGNSWQIILHPTIWNESGLCRDL